MASSTAAKSVSVEHYLSDAAFEHFEYVDGVPVALNVGSGPHAVIQANCAMLLHRYLKKKPVGRVATELRCRLGSGNPRFYLPDVSVVLGGDELLRPETRFLDRAPEFVIEIRSPDDSLPRLFRKIDDYFADGTRLAWLVLPEESCVLALAPGTPMKTYMLGERLDGGEVLPGMEIAVDEIFA